MKKLIPIILILISFSAFSQDTKKMIDGKEYIIHTVIKKETLYRISKKYDVSKKEIRAANPELGWFTKEGQVLKIPTGFTDENIHVIEKGETLYGISRKYGVSIEELTTLNPEKALKLKVGDKLVLPKDKKNNVKKVVDKVEVERVIEKEVVADLVSETVVHTVKRGETLYGIAKMYSTTVAKLTELNSEKAKSLKIGDELKLPKDAVISTTIEEVKAELPTIKDVESLKEINHLVARGETFYSISKKYGTTVESIQKLNPGITELKIGDVLKISVSEDYGKPKLTLGEPVKMEEGKFNEIHKINPLKDKLEGLVKEKSYDITLFLPFMLDKNDTYQAKLNNKGKVYQYTEMSTHFYQGVQLALDSAKTLGISVNLSVYDTKKDTSTVGKYLQKDNVKNADLIIGPLFENPYKRVTKFAKSNKIQVVCPVSQSNKILFNNPYVTELKSSLPTQIDYLAKYIGENYNTENVICVSGKSKKDKYLASLFSKNYASTISEKSNNYRATAKKYKMTSYSDMKKFEMNLVKGKKNILIIPFTEVGMATAFFTQLNIQMAKRKLRGFEVEIFALENFMEYEGINIDFKLKFNLHVTSSSFVDYKDEKVIEFIKKYREKYGTEPTKYAFMGFDATFYHAITMNSFGKNYTPFYGSIKIPMLQSDFNLQRTDENSGFENQKVNILKYVDYELIKVD